MNWANDIQNLFSSYMLIVANDAISVNYKNWHFKIQLLCWSFIPNSYPFKTYTFKKALLIYILMVPFLSLNPIQFYFYLRILSFIFMPENVYWLPCHTSLKQTKGEIKIIKITLNIRMDISLFKTPGLSTSINKEFIPKFNKY